MRQLGLQLISLAVALFGLAAGRDAVDAWIDATDLPPLVAETGVEVLARDGSLLRAYQVDDGRWRLAAGTVDPLLVEMLIAWEDKRFRRHNGVDPIAMVRAAVTSVRAGRPVSGASTLTMQVARLIEDGPTGTLSGKFRQIRVALALERRLTKDQILALYFARAPYGGNIEGVRAAAFVWFGKPERRFTPAEAALLVALPQAPTSRRPDRHPEAARVARDRILARMADLGVISDEAARAALTEPVPTDRRPMPALAPHLADRLLAEAPATKVFETTIDARLQRSLEALAAEAARGAGPRMQVALVVADHRTGEILASVGSAGYGDDRDGFVDMTVAPRSPGSTLKPLVYALAFDRGLVHPETLIADAPVRFGSYAPQNFDGAWRGDIRVGEALRLSLNVPVVKVLDAMGPEHLMKGMRDAGMTPGLDGRAGLAVALGGVGVTLTDLVRLYAGLANMGEAVDLSPLRRGAQEAAPPRRIVGPVAAWQVGDILLETPRPRGVLAEGIAFKTGTSYGHRDTLSIGYDGQFVVGVWMGRADGTPVPGAFGAELAAPVLFDAFQRLRPEPVPLPPPPPQTLIVAGADLPPPLRRFGGAPASATEPPEMVFPPDGALVEGAVVPARVAGGTGPFVWLANGAPVARSHRREVLIEGLGPGMSSLTVIDAAGLADRAEITLRP